MNKYDYELNKIIEKYYNKQYTNTDLDVTSIIGSYIEKNNKCKFAIWGAGEHTETLYKYFSVELTNCMFIIDNNIDLIGKKFLGFNIIKPQDITKYDIDTIFISSYGGRKSIMENIKQILPNCNAIDFYEYIEKDTGIKLSGPFYMNENTYNNLYKLNQQYSISECIDERDRILQNIIYSYISIRDFYNTIKFINLYIEKGYSRKDEFINLLCELKVLFNNLKENLMKRKGNDIVLLFLDSLRAKDVFNNSSMKYLNSILKQSMYFTNAFAPSIFTYESVPSILKGKLPFYNQLYKRKTINEEEVNFVQEALSKGYDINIYSISYWDIIYGKNINYREYSPIMSKNIWNLVTDLTESNNKKTISLLYFFQETHPPHICGYHTVKPVGHNTPFTCNDIVKQSQEEFNIQYNDCLKYVDNQLEFYFDIMGEDITKILFSDHGQIVEKAMSNLEKIGTLAGWHDERFNIPLILNGSRIKPSRCNDIFSMVYFNDLIISLINNTEYSNSQKYIEVNFSKICNDTIKQKYVKVGYDDYLYGFRVLRDDKYKLVITGNGKYKVYILPEQFEECRDKQVIEKVKKHFSKMVDISVPNL